MRFDRACATLGVLVAAAGAAACDGKQETPIAGVSPSFSYTPTGANCEFGGDFSDDVTFQRDDCSLADNGFTDQTVSFQFTDPNLIYLPRNPNKVYFVHEARLTSGGDGYRIADARFYSTGGVTTNTFSLTLLEELTGSAFIASVGACPQQYSDPFACAAWAFANDSHEEPRMCVWNETGGASGPSTFCSLLSTFIPTNQLPTANFAGSELSKATTSATWRFNAGSSTDPETQALTYHWRFDGGTVETTTSPIYDRVFTTAGQHSARLRVTDPNDGTDARVQSFIVVFEPPPAPLVVSFGMEPTPVKPNRVCTWRATAGGGAGSYTYTWFKGGNKVASGSQVSVNTGTSSFWMRVNARDGAGQSVSRSTFVTVTSSSRYDCTY